MEGEVHVEPHVHAAAGVRPNGPVGDMLFVPRSCHPTVPGWLQPRFSANRPQGRCATVAIGIAVVDGHAHGVLTCDLARDLPVLRPRHTATTSER